MITPQEHEYSVMGGANRAKVGRLLSFAASAISGALVFMLLAAVDLAKEFGWNANVPPTLMSLLGAGAVFGFLYWLLNKWAWKWPGISFVLNVPDISGNWDCVGKTLDSEGPTKYDWQAEVTIVQSWDRLRIRLSTQTSGSSSISAALAHDSVDGFVLLYHYRNDPKVGAVGLASHTGCSVMTIAKDLQSASGDYFNGRGRMSFGTMNWTKRN
ncbi:Cap15 family CBASS effector [Microvirgula aerodenitrificans]|uniref:Cap15 family cyclic dinucleotide receptor domain-containing protein n=1 Tax=Microvirgula aerodenitrificans TaxID=57480 RepID=UPI00048C63E7|nr:membrane protein [Microvirgula aerodenitrificans]